MLFVNVLVYHRPKSSGRVTHDSHKLQTKSINHLTSHYMNRIELQSEQAIHVPLLRVLTSACSQCIVAVVGDACHT